MERDFESFSGHPAVAAKRRKGIKTSAMARVLPLQRSETLQGRKTFMSANEAIFQSYP
jgi:hypothetical protein